MTFRNTTFDLTATRNAKTKSTLDESLAPDFGKGIMPYQDFSKQRLASLQPCMVYDRTHPNGHQVDYSSPNFNADHFSVARGSPSPRIGTRIKPGQVQISVPTLGLRPYLLVTIRQIIDAIQRDFDSSRSTGLPKIVVLSNGNTDRSSLKQFVDEFINGPNSQIEVTLVSTLEPNKSNALNLLHQQALRSSHEILINLDDDIRLPPGALSAIFEELSDGIPKFVGLPTHPDPTSVMDSVEHDIFNMVVAKRRVMGWPAPIGRINALMTSVFPTITNYETYDDVFLSAFFFVNRIPQYVLDSPSITYKAASSLFEYIKRTRRIKSSDERIVELLPAEKKSQYFNQIIRPTPLQEPSSNDAKWLQLSNHLLLHAESHGLFSSDTPSLEETDLSSKEGHQMIFVTDSGSILKKEMDRMKIVLGLA